MSSVVIYLVCEGKEESVEIYSYDTLEDVRSLFRSAALAEPEDELRLYNENGNLIFIGPQIKPNDPTTRYKLRVIRKAICLERLVLLMPAATDDLNRIEHKLSQFEKTLTECEMPETMVDLQKKCKYILKAANGLKYLTFLRIPDDMIPYGKQRIMAAPFWWQPSPDRIKLHRTQIIELFSALVLAGTSDEIREQLRTSSFDAWQCSDAHMLLYIRQMFIDLDLVADFHIDDQILCSFLIKVYNKYNFVPFHNFRHCFSVTQMMYTLIWILDLRPQFDQVDIFTLLTTAICHDLDHPGFNNNFQQVTQTALYQKHPASPLEHHHVDMALEILNDASSSIDQFLPLQRRQPYRDLMTKIILATDLTKSKMIVNAVKDITELDLTNDEHKHALMTAFIEVSDLSNEARGKPVNERWLDCLLQEFFTQFEVETQDGLPQTPFMDKDKVTKPSSQIGFIIGLLLPVLEAVKRFFPNIKVLIDQAQENLKGYQNMQMEFTPEDVKDQTADPAKKSSDEKNGSTPQDEKNGSATPDSDTKNVSMPPGDDEKAVSTLESEGSTPQETDPAEPAKDQAQAAPQE